MVFYDETLCNLIIDKKEVCAMILVEINLQSTNVFI